jgi:hypothetical protein
LVQDFVEVIFHDSNALGQEEASGRAILPPVQTADQPFLGSTQWLEHLLPPDVS